MFDTPVISTRRPRGSVPELSLRLTECQRQHATLSKLKSFGVSPEECKNNGLGRDILVKEGNKARFPEVEVEFDLLLMERELREQTPDYYLEAEELGREYCDGMAVAELLDNWNVGHTLNREGGRVPSPSDDYLRMERENMLQNALGSRTPDYYQAPIIHRWEAEAFGNEFCDRMQKLDNGFQLYLGEDVTVHEVGKRLESTIGARHGKRIAAAFRKTKINGRQFLRLTDKKKKFSNSFSSMGVPYSLRLTLAKVLRRERKSMEAVGNAGFAHPGLHSEWMASARKPSFKSALPKTRTKKRKLDHGFPEVDTRYLGEDATVNEVGKWLESTIGGRNRKRVAFAFRKAKVNGRQFLRLIDTKKTLSNSFSSMGVPYSLRSTLTKVLRRERKRMEAVGNAGFAHPGLHSEWMASARKPSFKSALPKTRSKKRKLDHGFPEVDTLYLGEDATVNEVGKWLESTIGARHGKRVAFAFRKAKVNGRQFLRLTDTKKKLSNSFSSMGVPYSLRPTLTKVLRRERKRMEAVGNAGLHSKWTATGRKPSFKSALPKARSKKQILDHGFPEVDIVLKAA